MAIKDDLADLRRDMATHLADLRKDAKADLGDLMDDLIESLDEIQMNCNEKFKKIFDFMGDARKKFGIGKQNKDRQCTLI